MSRFGLESPAWLAAAAAILPLIWLYLWRRRRPPAVVSSLVVWRAVAKPALPRRRPRLPLLFYVQALLIAAATLAAAGLFQRRPAPAGPPRDAVIVLDVSASMQARLGDGTRFDAAREAAAARAEELGGRGRSVTVVAAGQQPAVLGAGLGGAAAAALIRAQQPLDTAGNLTAATELAATRAGAKGSVDLFTDLPRQDLVMSRDARAATTVHRFGTGGENVALLGLRVQTNPFEGLAHTRILGTVRNFSDRPRQVTVEIVPLAAGAGTAGGRAEAGSAADGAAGGAAGAGGTAGAAAPAGPGAAGTAPARILRRELSLPANGSEVLSVDGLTWSGPFEAVLRDGDDLPLDDVARGFVPPRRALEIVLITEDAALTRAFESLARKLGNLSLRVVAPADDQPGHPGEIAIFDRTAPPIPPAGNAVYLAPRQGNADVSVAGDAPEARFAELREHPLLAGVQNPETLLAGKAVQLGKGGPLRPVMLGRAGGREAPLVLAGEVGGRRVVATAFPLRAEGLSDADSLPTLVFTLNLLRWLSPTAGESPLERAAGERLRAGTAGDPSIVRLTAPDGSERALSPTEEVALEHVGLYRATDDENRTRDLLVNFTDPGESDIRRPGVSAAAPAVVEAERAATPDDEPVAATTEFPYTRDLVLLAALVMLLEWLVVAAARLRARPVADPDGSGTSGATSGPPAAASAAGGI